MQEAFSGERDAMSEVPFYQTRMGRVYYEVTLPSLVQQLSRIGDLLQRLVDAADHVEKPEVDVPSRGSEDEE
jgi:hypothetical protein